MIAYGLTKNMSSHIHSSGMCDICTSSISKKAGRGKARMEKKKVIRNEIVNYEND